jgi:hypothetical protein
VQLSSRGPTREDVIKRDPSTGVVPADQDARVLNPLGITKEGLPRFTRGSRYVMNSGMKTDAASLAVVVR